VEDNSRDAGSGDEIRRGVDNGRSADTTQTFGHDSDLSFVEAPDAGR
jgi:hypothetical protein